MNTISLGFSILQKETWNQNTDPALSVNDGNQSSPDQAYSGIAEIANDIKASADIAVGLVSDLLLYDKLDEGVLLVEKKPLKIWRVIEDSARLFRVQVGLYTSAILTD